MLRRSIPELNCRIYVALCSQAPTPYAIILLSEPDYLTGIMIIMKTRQAAKFNDNLLFYIPTLLTHIFHFRLVPIVMLNWEP